MNGFKHDYMTVQQFIVTNEEVDVTHFDGEVRKMFTWEMPEDGDVTVPILTQVIITPEYVECYWGEPGRSPSMRFDRISV